MNFGECFRTLCCTFGAGELSLVQGEMPVVLATKIAKIKERLMLEDLCEGFLEKVDDLECELDCLDNPIKGIQKLLALEDPSDKIAQIVSELNSQFYDINEISKILAPYYLFSKEYRDKNISKTLKILEKDCVERDLFLGFFCFFDLSQHFVKIVSAKKLKGTNLYIEQSESRFCLANLDFSHYNQDIFIAEGFCHNFNSMLRRNGQCEFVIIMDS